MDARKRNKFILEMRRQNILVALQCGLIDVETAELLFKSLEVNRQACPPGSAQDVDRHRRRKRRR
jgi:hypothetical protein